MMSADRWRVFCAALAAAFFVAHLALLPPSLEDVDSTNFALGLRDFNVAAHQPHAPGYPLYIALGKISKTVLDVTAGSLPAATRDAHALAFWGALLGGLAAFPLFQFFLCLEASPRRAAAATALTLCSPLFWFTAARPMSDVTGLAVGLSALAWLATGFRRQDPAAPTARVSAPGRESLDREIASGRMLVAGALASGLAIGFRLQNAWIALPLLLLALVNRIGRGAAGALLGTGMTFPIGVLVWAVPLLALSGGIEGYMGILRAQALEDFSGVDMLYRNPTLRRLAFGLFHTFVQPWGNAVLAGAVLALAAAGAVLLILRSRSAVLLLFVTFGVYGAFHLLLQETFTVRYALPLVPPVAYLVVRALDALPGDRAMPVAVAVLVTASLVYVVPRHVAYTRQASPASAALAEVNAKMAPDDAHGLTLGLHQVFRRTVETAEIGRARVLPGPPMREWLQLVDYWRRGETAPVAFLADPRRGDLALIDPASRHMVASYRWSFDRLPLMGGVRPDLVDLIRIDSPPAWFAGEGWHLTPETLGMSEREPRREAVAYVRPRQDAGVLFLGGEYLPAPGGPPVIVTISLDNRALETWTVAPDRPFFLRKLRLQKVETVEADGFARLVVNYQAADGTVAPVHVRLTQFDLQPDTALVTVFARGWHELEYNMVTDRHWRWSSDRAETVVHNGGGRDLSLHLTGESPLESFDAVPHIVIRAGDVVLARSEPSEDEDFELNVTIPAAVLTAANGVITLETDRVFVPAERSMVGDRRRLGLRIYEFEITPAF